ncbi:MAG: cytidylyltransferase domain-containing protein [Bacteroidales bacterium]
MKTGVIIQARMGSTRLPGKVMREFHNGKSILEIIVKKVEKVTDLPITIATSVNNENNVIREYGFRNNIEVYSGSENDVLSRFYNIAKEKNYTHCIRICADNPFLDVEQFKNLLTEVKKQPEHDYMSYFIYEKPVIQTHFGFWAESISYFAIKQLMRLDDKKTHEHVTIGVYENPKQFMIVKLNPPDSIINSKMLRLTIDTIQDYKIVQKLYKKFGDNGNNVSLLEYVNKDEEIMNMMQEQINNNNK